MADPIPFKPETWPVDADGFAPDLCTVCGTPVRYGSRHSQCAPGWKAPTATPTAGIPLEGVKAGDEIPLPTWLAPEVQAVEKASEPELDAMLRAEGLDPETAAESAGRAINRAYIVAAHEALATLRQHYGKSPICCGNFVPGHPGDGWMQPPDGPECCQCPDRDVNTLCDVIRDVLPPAPSAAASTPQAKIARTRGAE